jgi:hypothetical protein
MNGMFELALFWPERFSKLRREMTETVRRVQALETRLRRLEDPIGGSCALCGQSHPWDYCLEERTT